jgi:UDP-3-O-[3-hydroxymyristoyl] glucosamine N-acyltransferase
MSYRVKDIAAALGAGFEGDGDYLVSTVAEPAHAKSDQIALALSPKYAGDLSLGNAEVAVLWTGADWQSYNLKGAIFAPRPRYALSGMSVMMDPGQGYEAGIHPQAYIDSSATIGKNVTIGAFSYVGAHAIIGDDTIIAAQVNIGTKSQIGKGAYMREGVKIGARVTIGTGFIAQPGVVVGSDGFSFVTEEVSGVENVRKTLGDRKEAAKDQVWTRIHSLGSVTIGNNVELGANTCVDCGTVRDTVIGNSVKCDNLVHIGHNATIDDNCLICGQVGIAGSARIGKNVVLAGQTGVNDNIFVGDNVIAGGATKIFTNVPAGRVILGYPAVKMERHIEIYKALRRLPRLFKDVAELQKNILNLVGKK